MQASGKQTVMTHVMQSQANKDFWSAYAGWQEKATQAEAKRTIKNMIRDVMNDVQATAFYQNLLGITSFAKLAVALALLLFAVNGIQVSEDIPTVLCNDTPEMSDTTETVWCVGKGGGNEVGSRGGSPSTRYNSNSIISETINSRGNITSRHTLTQSQALELGIQWLGNDYYMVGKGVYRSNVPNLDGSFNQFRLDDGSLMGRHDPGRPHIHLEIIVPGSKLPIINNHILLME